MYNVKKRIDSAPRFRKKFKETLTKEFVETLYSKTSITYNIKVIKEIIYTFNQNICDEIISNRDGINLPGSLGKVFIGSCKIKAKIIDHKKSQELGKKVYHQNYESNGHIAKIFYTLLSTNYKLRNSKMYKFKNAEIYGLKPALEFQRKVAKIYPKQWKLYRVVDTSVSLEKQEKMNYAINKNMENKEEILKTYNEFEL